MYICYNSFRIKPIFEFLFIYFIEEYVMILWLKNLAFK